MDGQRETRQESGDTGLTRTVKCEKGRTRGGDLAKEREAGCRFTWGWWEEGGAGN